MRSRHGQKSAGEQVLLAKPETFMNLSGMAVRELVAKHEIRPETDLIVIYDELDLPLGTIRIRQRGSSAGHNGMKSIIAALGTQEFLRIRLGVSPERKIADGVKFVLTPFRKSQLKKVDEVLDSAAEAVNVILKEGPAAAMNRFNRKAEANVGASVLAIVHGSAGFEVRSARASDARAYIENRTW